ncbi:hypothetical protein GKO32_15575 [Amycolatopsis sp. RM579]|uniref:Transmembrane protein n=1 Tax=Amycolatopsis pithecellobii TaxID=664692 RepID=A0A6N7YQU7_9PSEU|nr:hypothetical protein [Amycolatopsis pithecellobii]
MARFWRRIHLGRNPLARRSDRVEAAMLMVVAVGLLAAIPLAVILGSGTYHSQAAISAQQQSSRHLVTATLVENAPSPVTGIDSAYLNADGSTTGVHARWAVPGGGQQIGLVSANPGATAGTQVPVWLGEAGAPVPPPLTPTDAVTTSVLTAVFSWLLAALVLVGVYLATRLILDRRRAVHWDREWLYAGDRWARF